MADLVLELVDHPGREPGADEPPLPDMIVAIHADEHHPGHKGLVAQLRPVEGTKQLGVAAYRLDILVLRQHPEALVVIAGESLREGLPLHRFVMAKGGEDLVWEPIPIERCVGEVHVEVAGVVGGIDQRAHPPGRERPVVPCS